MSAPIVDLDKSLESEVDAEYGTITIRVIVLEKSSTPPPADEPTPIDASADEVLPETDSKRPINSYLETPSRGKFCCVFLINGQRQHAWDNTFIVRDLELKYLRNRMLVIVDVDGLKPQAIAKLMQGSRQQFYEGEVYDALTRRVIATLKGDPDLLRLEAEAEQEVSSLQAGDEVVKAALDQLIESHHEFGARSAHGHRQGGTESRDETTQGDLAQTQTVVTQADTSTGQPAESPLLIMVPDMMTVRLKPNDTRRVSFRAAPAEDWSKLDRLVLTVMPPVKELQVKQETQADRATVDLTFDEPEDFDDDEYPIATTLKASAHFKGHPEPRVCERRVVISNPGKRRPRKPPVLHDNPTFIRITSRQPVRMTIGGPDVHIKMKWDGKDSLVTGDQPLWSFKAACLSGQVVPEITFSRPSNGRFEALVRMPGGLTTGEKLQFQIEAIGPTGQLLSTSFEAEAVEPPSPRRIAEQVLGGSQRKPPYKLVYINRDQWNNGTCWASGDWTENDPGCFQPPSQSEPLTLIVNQDYGLLASYRDSLVSRQSKLAESTVQERTTRYTSHVAFHLWKMYSDRKQREDAANQDQNIRIPGEDELRGEINRVAETLIRLMQVSR
jgi:hypothetical protein